MFKVLHIDDRAADVESRVSEFTSEGLLGQEANFSIDVILPKLFEAMGKELLNAFIEQRSYQALILDWNLSEKPLDGGPAVAYRAAELGQYLRREIAEEERGDVCFPIFVLSSQKYLDTLYTKDKASHDIFDNVYKKEAFFLRDTGPEIISEITCFIKAYDKLHQIYRKKTDFLSSNIPLLEIVSSLLNKNAISVEKLINFSELSIPHPYGYAKFIHHEMLKKTGPLVDAQLLSARLGVSFESFALLEPHLVSAKYTGIMHEKYDRWWMMDVEKWWQDISSDPLVFLGAEERVATINDKLGLSLTPAKAIGDDYSNFYWHLSKVTGTPLDESDAIRLLGSRKFDWQDYQYLSKADYLSGTYELRPNESVDNDDLISKLG